MPKDDFASLERRFRERPLFGPTRRRRPRLKTAGLALVVLMLGGLVAPQGQSAVEALSRLVDVKAQPAVEPPAADRDALPVLLQPPAPRAAQDGF